MPKIKTTKGSIKYKTIPLYEGSTQIDKAIASENLKILKNIMDKHNIPFILVSGTLLGAVREHDFIDHDEDIDLGLLGKYWQAVLDLSCEFMEAGFKIARCDRHCVYSIIRNGQYIDLCFFYEYDNLIHSCSGYPMISEYLLNTTYMSFLGEQYLVPRDYEDYLDCEFGKNWRTPVKYFDFDIPFWKKKLIEYKEAFKEQIPDVIFFPLKRRAEKKLIKFYQPIIDRYLEKKNLLNKTKVIGLTGKQSKKHQIIRLLWGGVSSTAKILPRNASRPYMHFLLKLFGAKLHPQSYIYGSARIYYPANLVMERMATIGPEADIYNVDKITLKENTIVSQKSYLCTASHSIDVVDGPLITAPIVIEKDAWVAADTFIGMGVTVGEGAVVGARAAVFKDVEPWTVVGGNPAKFIKRRDLKNN